MAPARGSKPEINPWSWVYSVEPDKVGLEQILRAYRILEFTYCEDSRRVCKRNPFCYWGLGEKKWVHGAEDGSEDEDNGFREEGEFAGLQNLGATCYVNSLLQLWYHNPILRPAILRWQPSFEAQNNELYRPDGPIGELQAMFARMKMSKKSKIDPREFVNALKLDTGEQQDAQEFSKLFMEVILRQMLTAEYADGTVRDAVASAFRGELQNENECTGCSNKTQRQESFNELELGVMKNLNESLDELLKDERLTDSNQYYCSICQKKNDAIRRTQLLKLPPVLNLQLMRFVFDRETYRKKKVTTTIQFPEVLDMSSRVHQSFKSTKKDALMYHLSAVLVHNGPSASSGHYVAQIKDLRTGIWHKFNDENVDRDRVANNAKKSQKLDLKEDEGESDNDKSKLKKGNKSSVPPGFHSSQGAYMLVYTLERFIKEPEPDPEPWPYLQKMIKREDEEYEEEVKKSKNDKDYENNQKEQRKREIATLYPSLQLTKKVDKSSDADDSDKDDFQPPPKKVARSDMNGVSKHVDVSSRNGNGVKKENIQNNNGIAANSKTVPKKSKADQDAEDGTTALKNVLSLLRCFDESSTEAAVSNIHFIASEWLQQWLDAINPPPPIENKIISCEHGLLAPTAPGTIHCKYRAIPSTFAKVLYENYTVDGPKLEGIDALCLICVQRECQRLRKLNELENDYKVFVETNKKFDLITAAREKSGELADPSTSAANGLWLSKDVLKNWKRIAKSNIEDDFKSCSESISTVDGDAETQEDDSDISSLPFNTELICSHNNLIPIVSLRKIIPEASWDILRKYFPKCVPIWEVEKEDCIECMNAKIGDNEIRNLNKEHAQKQRSSLIDLYLERNRPNVSKAGSVVCAVSYDFYSRWKKFIKEPTKYNPVTDVKNESLLCPTHGKFMYPLNHHDEVVKIKPEEQKYRLVYPAEWDAICKIFSTDIKIEIEVVSSNEVKYNPDFCEECSTEWWLQALQQKFNYTNQPIHIIRREKPNTEEQSDDDDLFTPVIPISSKRVRKPHDPAGWSTPNWSAATTSKDAATVKSGVRISARRRRPRGEKSKTLKISSSNTLKELKVMITRSFDALLSDQHLFFEDEELKDDKLSSTLGELQIPADSTLYLEVDTVSKEDDDDPVDRPTVVENGFFGTLLLNNSPSSSPSPVAVIDDLKSS